MTQNVVVVDSAGAPPPTTIVVAHEHEKEKEDLVRAWEEELARIENASRRSSAGMLSFFGGAGKKLRGRLGREGKVGAGG